MVLEKTLESPLDSKEIQPVHPKGNQSWVFIYRTDVEMQAVCTGVPQGSVFTKLPAWILGCQYVEEVRNPEQSTWTFCGSNGSNPDPGPSSVCTLPQSPQMLRLDPSQTLEYLLSCWQNSQRQQQERGGYGGSSPFLACALIVGFQWQYMFTVL